jgi:antitoxin component YwqK of YwqJK toxin-antitoxin module
MNKNGRQGSDTRWHNNGQLLVFTIYENGKAISPTTSWYSNGGIRHFNERNSHKKLSMEWYKNGNLAQVVEKTDSTTKSIIIKDYYETGELSEEGNYNNGEQVYKMYWKNGLVGRKGNMINLSLMKVGKWEEWYENGQLRLESYYHDSIPNLKVNTWKTWNEKGGLIKEEEYKNGELIDIKEYMPLNKKLD